MTYQDISTVNATEDISELLVYVNSITNGLAMPSVLVAFFLITFIGGAFAQLRFRGSVRIDFSFAAASFSTFGFAVLMSLKNGLLNPLYLFVSLFMVILAVIWLYLSSE